MEALAHTVHQGKVLYAGISCHPLDLTVKAGKILKGMDISCLIYQPECSMFERWAEDGLLDLPEESGIGCIAFSPLA